MLIAVFASVGELGYSPKRDETLTLETPFKIG
jgi:hypothetical protein